jgi:hypothetical protein
MAGYVMKMNILVPNINHRGQKGLSFKVRHKAYACPLATIIRIKKPIIFEANDKVETK